MAKALLTWNVKNRTLVPSDVTFLEDVIAGQQETNKVTVLKVNLIALTSG